MAVHIPFSAHHPQNLLQPSGDLPLPIPFKLQQMSVPVYLSPHWQLSPPAPHPCLFSTSQNPGGQPWGRVWDSFLPLEQKGTRESGNNAITSHTVRAAPQSSELQHPHHECPGPHPAGMSRKHGMLSREVCSPSLHKYVAQGSTSRRSSKCHCPFLAWLYNIPNIKYYL